MIRFLNLKGQISQGDTSFMFYDTISDTLCSFNGRYIFDNKQDFIDAYSDGGYDNASLAVFGTSSRPIERFLVLIPKDYFTDPS